MLSASELASITSTVQSSLDASLPLYRNSPSTDSSGHSVENWASQGTISVNIKRPSATQLQTFAGLIGSQRALMLRAMQTTDIREGDRVVYDGLNWLVQNLQDAESYTVTREYLITTVA